MAINPEVKQHAILLRKSGLTYNEILREIPVVKSTLSLWLRDVGLATPQLQRITEKRKAGQRKAADAKRNQRIQRQKEIYESAALEIGTLSKRDMWLIGSVLYWGEGSKEKEYSPGNRVAFTNSDAGMIISFLSWLALFCHIVPDDISFELHIHENCKDRIDLVKKYWSEKTGFKASDFDTVYYKKHKILTKRKNIGDLYYGCLKVKVRGSSALLRRITGWNKAIASQMQSR